MGLQSALFTSVSGLDTTSTAITVAGDNIANINTPGFKERRAEFSDVLGQSIASAGGFSQLGAGAKVGRVGTIFSQGTFETTSRSTDLAIEGQGFFILEGQGRFYSRAGILGFDNQGFMTNPEGLRVQGFGIDPVSGLSNGQLGDIQISGAIAPPQATSATELSVNLDSNAPIVGAFDATNPNTTSNFRTVINVYDTQGNAHPATVFFSKTGANGWDVNVALPTANTSVPPVDPGDTFVVQNSGFTPISMTFDNNGNLTAPVAASSIPFRFSGLVGAPTQTIDLSFGNVLGAQVDPTTQFSAQSATNSFVQDGFAPGTLQGIIIDQDGFVTGQFSNGESRNLAQIGLATFPAVESLLSVGNNRLLESRGSGQAIVGAALTGSFGSIRASTLEQSNVDLAAQFVKLIIHQRAFQANTRTVSVTNELLANLNSLGQ